MMETTRKPETAPRQYDVLAEIRELNLTYLMLAQQMYRDDPEAAVYRLGMSDDLAGIIASLSPAQLLKMASTNLCLCRLRFDDELILSLLSANDSQRSLPKAHAAVLLAGEKVEDIG